MGSGAEAHRSIPPVRAVFAAVVAVCILVHGGAVAATAAPTDPNLVPGVDTSLPPEPEPQPAPEYLPPPPPGTAEEALPFVPIPPLVADFSYLARGSTSVPPAAGSRPPVRSSTSQSEAVSAVSAADEIALARAIILEQIAASVTRVCESIAFLRAPGQPPKNAS